MDDQDLRKQLEQLHMEIEKTSALDEEGRQMLLHLQADIRNLLERSEGGPIQPHPTVVQGMVNSVEYFEATHPTLTNVLNQVLATLSNAGI
jgi:hypothetical protein